MGFIFKDEEKSWEKPMEARDKTRKEVTKSFLSQSRLCEVKMSSFFYFFGLTSVYMPIRKKFPQKTQQLAPVQEKQNKNHSSIPPYCPKKQGFGFGAKLNSSGIKITNRKMKIKGIEKDKKNDKNHFP